MGARCSAISSIALVIASGSSCDVQLSVKFVLRRPSRSDVPASRVEPGMKAATESERVSDAAAHLNCATDKSGWATHASIALTQSEPNAFLAGASESGNHPG